MTKECDHINKIIEWGFDENFNYVATKYGCTKCDATSKNGWESKDIWTGHAEHTSYVDGCFGCKVGTLELNPGDAGRAEAMPQKKWDAELKAYRDARAQGIQPAGTTMKKINEAKAASDKLGVAYDAGAMPSADKITKKHATALKDIGAI